MSHFLETNLFSKIYKFKNKFKANLGFQNFLKTKNNSDCDDQLNIDTAIRRDDSKGNMNFFGRKVKFLTPF